ncbi:Phosphinothricin N-acetyltransferase [Pseudobythopirellula maris]|uniref:Phosphinothricin N-acetyltransferase n=1 Tax=Pseudobythopirellula maris TaxID=2527991 RepID=A0A5C5ZTW4_9BACT|nr:GNAT family N-acetyltransferase [Pseudobythopirellula maris]TWT90646.1 Phosphinothricin N-acetyltransferase [Pseudobythopirellula maris]
MIRDATPADAAAIAELYNHYVRESTVTFEEEPVTAEAIAARMREVNERFPWLLLEEDGALVGYAYARHWQTRSAYRHTVETSVYVAHDRRGKGHGPDLYRALLGRLPACDVHAVVAGVTLPNPASVAMHDKLGFKKAAHYTEVGRKFDRWLDVGYWHMVLADKTQ